MTPSLPTTPPAPSHLSFVRGCLSALALLGMVPAFFLMQFAFGFASEKHGQEALRFVEGGVLLVVCLACLGLVVVGALARWRLRWLVLLLIAGSIWIWWPTILTDIPWAVRPPALLRETFPLPSDNSLQQATIRYHPLWSRDGYDAQPDGAPQLQVETTASVEEAATFYRAELPAYGWTIVADRRSEERPLVDEKRTLIIQKHGITMELRARATGRSTAVAIEERRSEE